MSFMTESLLLEAQTLRLHGDIDASIHILRTVLAQCNADIDCPTNEDAIETTNQLRQMGAYQLAVLLLQRSGRCWLSATVTDGVFATKEGLLENASKDEAEADTLLWKLGYRLRLSTNAFGYPPCSCVGDTITSSDDLPFHIIDNSMPSVLFEALQFAFRVDSRYWTEFYSKANVDREPSRRRNVHKQEANSDDQNRNDGEQDSTHFLQNQFVSHNISLLKSSAADTRNLLRYLQHSNSLLEQVAIIAQHKLECRFPMLKNATSVEVWCHQRPPDGSHQLHYDMDEIRLWETRKRSLPADKSDNIPSHTQIGSKRQKVRSSTEIHACNNGHDIGRDGVTPQQERIKEDGIPCPMVSCVLTIHVPHNSGACLRCGETAKGAPTIVCNQSILEHSQTRANPPDSNGNGVGWLCHPKPNRLLAFEGSLLHGVVPGIPDPGSYYSLSDDDDDAESTVSCNVSVSPDCESVSDRQYSKRITLMMGFWSDGVCINSFNNDSKDCASVMGPNMPFPIISNRDPTHPWASEFAPVSISGNNDMDDTCSVYPHANYLQLNPLWKSISLDNGKFGEYVDGKVKGAYQFSGRFFLKSGNTSEIDDEVLPLIRR
ncbi:hypothetical protein ACHAW6_003826 [Cyclotella cf. meneghiniana]